MTDSRFPLLTQKQIATLKPYGKQVTFDDETVIFKAGDTTYDFYVIIVE